VVRGINSRVGWGSENLCRKSSLLAASIGFATTTCFLQNGYDIVIIARDFSAFPLHETHVQQVRFDLRHYRDIPRVVNEIGAIDILVNNAGILQSCWCRHPGVDR